MLVVSVVLKLPRHKSQEEHQDEIQTKLVGCNSILGIKLYQN